MITVQNSTKELLSMKSENSLASILMLTLARARHGTISVKLETGRVLQFKGDLPGPHADIHIFDSRFYELLFDRGDIGLGEAFMDNYWSTTSVANVIEFAILNRQILERAITGEWSNLLWYKLRHFFNRNSKAGSKRNIEAHYDLGNSFYSLWLDRTMTYSAAYWNKQPEINIEDAQVAKYQLLLDQLGAEPGSHILEIGCGWGGFAEHAAKQGFNVTGITISQEQFNYATKRMQTAGLDSLVQIQLIDYRELKGKFDHIVSIEMIEAVGEKYWPEYFSQLKRLIKPNGKIAIQSIVINDKSFAQYKKGTDFIQQYIFPGGMLLSPKKLRELAMQIKGTDISLVHFGNDYAQTLRIWSESFNQVKVHVRELGFDERFIRMWNFYLGYCEGAFTGKHIDVVVMSFKIK